VTTSPVLPPEKSRAGPRPEPTAGHRAIYAVYRALTGLLLLLSDRVSDALAGGLARLLYRVPAFRLKDTLEHLELAFPDESPAWRRRVARDAYRHLVREAVQVLRLHGLGVEEIRKRTTVEGIEELKEVMAGGQGAVIVTGHVGNWEMSAAAVASRGVPVDVVAYRQKNPLFDLHWVRVRESVGIRTLVNVDAFKLVPQSLEDGRLVALLGDQNQRERGLFVPFFGKLAATSKGPALFALRADVPIFVGAGVREPGWPPRYRVEVRRIDLPSEGGWRERLEETTRRHVALLEEWVKQNPEQYFWMHRRWKTRPEGGSEVHPDGTR